MTNRSQSVDMGAVSVRTMSLISLFAIFALYAVPVGYVLVSSFKTNVDIINYPLNLLFTPTLEAYRNIINPSLLSALINSLIITGISTVVIVFCAVPLAYVLSKVSATMTSVVVFGLIVLQMVPASTSVIPLYSLLPKLGLIGTLSGVALSIAAGTTPYAVLLLRPFFFAVPNEVVEAAELDGAGPYRIFFDITLPLVQNGILVITILVAIGAWGEFLFSISFLSNASQYPLSVLLVMQQGQYGTLYNNLMALAFLGSLPTIILFMFAAKRLTSGLALGAGK